MCSGRGRLRRWLRCWLTGAARPGAVVAELTSGPPQLLPAVLLAIVSSALFLSGILLAGGAVYHGFVERYSTYLLEKLTGSGVLGSQPSRYDSGRVFLEGSVFVVKMWAVLALLVQGIGRLLGLRRGLRETLSSLAWSLFPQCWLLLLAALASRVLRWVLPWIHGQLYALALAAVLLILVPLTLQRFWDAGSPERAPGDLEGSGKAPGCRAAGIGRLYGAYYGALLVLFLLWTWNHPSLALLRVL